MHHFQAEYTQQTTKMMFRGLSATPNVELWNLVLLCYAIKINNLIAVD